MTTRRYSVTAVLHDGDANVWNFSWWDASSLEIVKTGIHTQRDYFNLDMVDGSTFKHRNPFVKVSVAGTLDECCNLLQTTGNTNIMQRLIEELV